MDAFGSRSDRDASAWVAELADGPLAVDTEADSFHHYREKVCLSSCRQAERARSGGPACVDRSGAARSAARDMRRSGSCCHGADYDDPTAHAGLRSRHHRPFGHDDRRAPSAGSRRSAWRRSLAKHLGVTLDEAHQRGRLVQAALPGRACAPTRWTTRGISRRSPRSSTGGSRSWEAAWMRGGVRAAESVRWRDRGARRSGARTAAPRARNRSIGLGLAVLREVWRWRDEAARRRTGLISACCGTRRSWRWPRPSRDDRRARADLRNPGLAGTLAVRERPPDRGQTRRELPGERAPVTPGSRYARGSSRPWNHGSRSSSNAGTRSPDRWRSTRRGGAPRRHGRSGQADRSRARTPGGRRSSGAGRPASSGRCWAQSKKADGQLFQR